MSYPVQVTPAEVRKLVEACGPTESIQIQIKRAAMNKMIESGKPIVESGKPIVESGKPIVESGEAFKVVKVSAAEAKKMVEAGEAVKVVSLAAAEPEMSDMEFLNKYVALEFNDGITPSVRTKFLAVCRRAIEMAEMDEHEPYFTPAQEKNITFRPAKRAKNSFEEE